MQKCILKSIDYFIHINLNFRASSQQRKSLNNMSWRWWDDGWSFTVSRLLRSLNSRLIGVWGGIYPEIELKLVNVVNIKIKLSLKQGPKWLKVWDALKFWSALEPRHKANALLETHFKWQLRRIQFKKLFNFL